MAQAAKEQLATASYWNNVYRQPPTGSKPTHEWYSIQDIAGFLETHLYPTKPSSTSPRILHLGSGDSVVPAEFYEKGYTDQICMDFSRVVVEKMRRAHANKPGIQWLEGDVRIMADIPDASVDVAFDKGTLDAMTYENSWHPPPPVVRNAEQYVNQVARVLKPGGIFLCITFQPVYFIKRYLVREGVWQTTSETLVREGGSIGYQGFVMKKP
ncbi:MAG: hypothetical protein M1820_009189 [Bogoriella megaspora]|nr:MAG: hypothetical protein M1820_009189 [Bogoriella megaspora]